MSTATCVERPILFSGEMVRAILAGRKTQTRRIARPQPPTVEAANALSGPDYYTTNAGLRCPYGKPGDRLWVRETWAANATLNLHKPSELRGESIYYRATHGNDSHFVWRPSIHMPKWASRITLEITGVRVERVDSISLEDAIAEGFKGYGEFLRVFYELNRGRCTAADNPWAWVVEFRRIN